MDDAFLVRRVERVGNLAGDGKRFGDRQRPARQALRQRLALDEFHHERGDAVAVLDCRES